MLSRVISNSLRISFPFSNTPAVRSAAGSSLLERAGVSLEKVSETQSALRQVEEIVQNERKHLSYYANEYPSQHAASISSSTIASASTSSRRPTARPSSSRHCPMAPTIPNWQKSSSLPQLPTCGTCCWASLPTSP